MLFVTLAGMFPAVLVVGPLALLAHLNPDGSSSLSVWLPPGRGAHEDLIKLAEHLPLTFSKVEACEADRQVDTEDGPVWVKAPDGFAVRAWDDYYEWTFWARERPEVEAELAAGQADRARVRRTWGRRTPYGSPAWSPEDEYELACFEADCYGEPRPAPSSMWNFW